MSNLSDFLGGGKPKLITRITSGTGTYVPTADMARCLIRRQGAGGAGGSPTISYGGGGGGGAFVENWERVPISGITYAVGAGGVGSAGAAIPGSPTRCGNVIAAGGHGGGQAVAGEGGPLGQNGGGGGAVGGAIGISGGSGGIISYKGSAPGFAAVNMNNGQSTASAYAGAGGDSVMGVGANALVSATNGNPSTIGYGGGGGGATQNFLGGTGGGGCIEIWDFGA